MKQLSLFSLFGNEKEKRELPPILTPKDIGECHEILGVRYSLNQVDGWCAVTDFRVVTRARAKSIPLADGVVWVDPDTILHAYNNFNHTITICWGWGPLYSVRDGQPVYMSYSGHTEQVGFDFVDIDSWKIAHGACQKKLPRMIWGGLSYERLSNYPRSRSYGNRYCAVSIYRTHQKR